MGFSRELAEEAIVRFEDDLHAGCHWLMMRETMGQIPKRLRRETVSEVTSYTGSCVRYMGLRWTVTDFDKKHALIRLKNINDLVRWEHISDARLEWVQVRHDEPSLTIPKASWRRSIGSVTVSLAWMDTQRLSECNSDNVLDKYIKHGRPTENGSQWTMWRCITTLTREYVHEPSRPKPKGVSSDDIHNFRVEWTSYFYSLCDYYSISQDAFTDALYNCSNEKVLEMFPEDTREDLGVKLKRWRHPQPYLSQLNAKWRKDCLPFIEFKCTNLSKKTFSVTFSVDIHNMTFVQTVGNDAGIHMQLQRLFFVLFPNTRPSMRHNGPMDQDFLTRILHDSRKNWQESSEPSPEFKTDLFPYQKKCLSWMIRRETKSFKSTSAWGWTRHQLDDGFVFHTSVFGQISLTPPNASIRGGLIAQDVGMGKTVEMLALIATNKAPGPTLVVLPTTMLSVWQAEAASRTPTLKVIKFHGARRTKNMNDLREADIVLTTYRIVVNETQQHVPSIGAVRWGRIILDESHELKHVHTETTKAICRLFAPYRWCVSATPWPKGMVHAAAMLSFLGVKPFDEAPMLGNFSAAQLLVRQHREHNPSLFFSLIKYFTWWQRKRHVSLSLPSITEEVIEVEFEFPELYHRLLDVIRFRLDLDGLIGRPTRTRILHYVRWLRQMATHASLNRLTNFGMPSATDEAESEYNTIDSFMKSLGTSNYEQALRDVIQSWRNGNETCCICRDAMDRPTLTPCNHMFCYDCIQASYQHDHTRRCPLCREPAGDRPLRELTEQEVPEDKDKKMWRSHDLQGYPVTIEMPLYEKIQKARSGVGVKFKALLDIIQKGDEKCIVFTQFHDAWKKVCECLKNHDISFVSIEGSQTPKKRSDAIHKFQSDPTTRAFIMTTKTASVGITLTAASRVIFLEPCHNAHLRKQAIGRVWRIGQKNPITVTTIKMSSTVDMLHTKDIMKHISPDAE